MFVIFFVLTAGGIILYCGLKLATALGERYLSVHYTSKSTRRHCLCPQLLGSAVRIVCNPCMCPLTPPLIVEQQQSFCAFPGRQVGSERSSTHSRAISRLSRRQINSATSWASPWTCASAARALGVEPTAMHDESIWSRALVFRSGWTEARQMDH